MKEKLEYLANVATIVACAAILGHIAMAQYTRYQNRPVPPYEPGDVIADTADLGLTNANLTVLLGTASTCVFCRESMSFYDRVAATARKHGTRLLSYTNEALDSNREFFAEHGVTVDAVIDAHDSKVTLDATPTLIVVKSDGRVVQAWRGKLNSEQETQLITLIQRGGEIGE
jgi:hypothetical protein